ncbi:protein CutA homolog [Anopheles cruzii]|uniref:protein CutA homolog n=1 Tax=Anopheles cruzii TaxID=68878 RepID=UPI0022EC4A25|nr:protein CutA homolog [Anopheles cruzii]
MSSITTTETTTSQDAANEYSVAFVTTPNEESAKTLARSVVEGKLAACVSVLPGLVSFYTWEDKLNESSECLLMIKTRTALVNSLIQFVVEKHEYDVPEVITLPITTGNPAYLDWIGKCVPNPGLPVKSKQNDTSKE